MLWNSLYRMRNACLRFMREEDGMAVVEVILIIVVFIALVIIFRDQMQEIINNIFETISTESSGV